MNITRNQYRAGLSTTRIEAFSDGVFAIAITLLILTIAVPEHAPAEISHGQLSSDVFALWPKILSFVVSFLVIGIFWVGHHIMFHYIKRADRMLLWLNTLLLMTISFFPFPVELIGTYGLEKTAVMLYGGTLCLAGILFYLLWYYASHRHHLIREDLNEDIILLGRKLILLAPLTYALAAAIAFWSPLLSVIIYILVPVIYIIPSPVDKLVHFASENAKDE